MGTGIGYVCKKCGAHKNLFYGIGFLGYKEYYVENIYQELVIPVTNYLKNGQIKEAKEYYISIYNKLKKLYVLNNN